MLVLAGAQVNKNKFEQDSSDDHQISLAGEGTLPCDLPHDSCDALPL